jgi:hypothetical protein
VCANVSAVTTGSKVRVRERRSAPRVEKRRKSNTTPSVTPSLPSRRRRRSLPLSSVKPRRSEWPDESEERRSLLTRSFKLLVIMTMTSRYFFPLYVL